MNQSLFGPFLSIPPLFCSPRSLSFSSSQLFSLQRLGVISEPSIPGAWLSPQGGHVHPVLPEIVPEIDANPVSLFAGVVRVAVASSDPHYRLALRARHVIHPTFFDLATHPCPGAPQNRFVTFSDRFGHFISHSCLVLTVAG